MKNLIFFFSISLLISCNSNKAEQGLVGYRIDCPDQLSPDSKVNYELHHTDLGGHEILCYQFENHTNSNLHFLTDSFSNKITNYNSYSFYDGRRLQDIGCSFSQRNKVKLNSQGVASGYILVPKITREFDSSFFEFDFFDQNDSVVKCKVKR